MGAAFARVSQRALPALIPKTYRRIGYWWHKHHELDVLGLATDGTLVAGECKYTARERTAGDLADLERSAGAVEWMPPGGATRRTTTVASVDPGSGTGYAGSPRSGPTSRCSRRPTSSARRSDDLERVRVECCPDDRLRPLHGAYFTSGATVNRSIHGRQ